MTKAGAVAIPADELAAKHGFSLEAVSVVAQGLLQSGGKAVQFNHPDLGGQGQWMSGMVMIGKMNDHALKARVNTLCSEIAGIIQRSGVASLSGVTFPASADAWWPESWNAPATTGAQNQTRYAYFPDRNRLLIEENGVRTAYDTTGYRLQGVSQQQSNSTGTLMFTTDSGPVSLDRFPVVSKI